MAMQARRKSPCRRLAPLLEDAGCGIGFGRRSLFETNNLAAIIERGRLWPGGNGPDILYSKALALSIDKRMSEVRAAVQECVAARPFESFFEKNMLNPNVDSPAR